MSSCGKVNVLNVHDTIPLHLQCVCVCIGRHVFTKLIDEDTVVFVFGDHGMSPTGDHGGETNLETDAALLVYSPRPLFNPLEV